MSIGNRWSRKYEFDKDCKQYLLMCYVLVDDEGYECGEYELSVRSWHKDLHNNHIKVADTFSEHRYKMTFRDKNEANRMYLWIVNNEPDYEELKAAGFKKSTW